MKEDQLHQELSSIRNMMERSSKFISLSGIAGVLAGIYAIIGAIIAYLLIRSDAGGTGLNFTELVNKLGYLIIIALAVLILSIATGLLLSYRKAKRVGQSIWGKTSRTLLYNMAIPLITGGMLVTILLYQGYWNMLLPVTLIFYGIALVNAGNFTYTDVKYLGLTEIVLGLAAVCAPAYGLILWTIGFGVLHIIYGTVMYIKYDRESTI